MSQDTLPATREEQARGYVRHLRNFYRLLFTAAIIVGMTGVINLIATPGRWWFFWVAFGFAIAIAFAGLNLLLRGRLFGAAWEERKVREILERDAR